ncbi:hypothetical protein RUM44_000365 [Polyplax serrata]|uniref:Neurexin n=1 Tax=Polyplax serrata TaxID=468196 RepID=A0ABR1B5A6_POLSC
MFTPLYKSVAFGKRKMSQGIATPTSQIDINIHIYTQIRRHGTIINYEKNEAWFSDQVLPNWDAKKSGTLAFKFRTVEDTALFMFSRGSGSVHPDFFGFEMIEGQMFLHFDLGSGHTKVRITTRRINDGAWHEVNLRRNGREGRVSVDDMIADFTTPGESTLLELDGGLFIGGVGNPLAPVEVPVYFWTGVLQLGFVGCMRDLIVNGNAIDIAGYARQQDTTSIRASCHVQSGQCEAQPCLNGGVCKDGWNRFTCDCSATNHGGPICGKEAATASFNGSQYIAIGLPEGTKTQAEDLIIRFKTYKKEGMIFSTNNDHFGDKLELSIQGGKLKMSFRIGGLEKTISTGQNLQDYTWHVIKFSRRGNFFYLKLDNYPIIRAEKDLDKDSILEYDTLYLGCYPVIVNQAHKVEGFGGVIQQFSFNGFPWLERLNIPYRINQVRAYPNVNVTARFLKRYDSTPYRTVTFRSKHTFFKTREPNGIILYNEGKGHDFLAVELVNGHIHYLFNLGDKTIRIRDNSKAGLNDNKWHSVAIGRPRVKQHTLQVDDTFVIVTNPGHHEDLDLTNLLYLGGVRKEAYKTLPKQIQSRHGYEGCLGSLDLNGESPNAVIEALIPSNQVVKGCEESTSFEFGPGGGIISFSIPENRQVETKADALTFGLITTKDNAILVRIESATTSDYIQLEIVEGNILVLYYLGTHENPISETGVKVDDDTYHVVRYTRSGPNSTLQIDDYNVQEYNPSGPQLSVFNTQGKVLIGGRWEANSHAIERPFSGVMSGFVFNGQRVLDLAAEKDPRVTVVGDVQPMSSISNRIHVPPPTMQQTPASNLPGLMDDLVYSGAGSGCQNDDEDQCLAIFDTGSGDDLITPVYVPPTSIPSTTKSAAGKVVNENQGNKPCDDEDCFVGSGNGEPTTEDTSSESNRGSTAVVGTTQEETTRGSSVTGETSSSTPTETTSTTQLTTKTFKTTFGVITTSSTTTTTTSTTSSTTTTTEYIEPPQPIPPWSSSRPPFYKKRDRISSESAENTALVIGIIAGTMIAVILIILIILRFKHKNASSYKSEENKCYQQSQGPNAALLPPACSGQFDQNGALRNGNGKSSRKQKDVKEWYV